MVMILVNDSVTWLVRVMDADQHYLYAYPDQGIFLFVVLDPGADRDLYRKN